MKRNFVNKFSFIFALIIFTQSTFCDVNLVNEIDGESEFSRYGETKNEDTTSQQDARGEKTKRAVSILSIDEIYEAMIVGCIKEKPELIKVAHKAIELEKKLIQKKSEVNEAWIPIKTIAGHTFILAIQTNTVQSQISEYYALVMSIVHNLDEDLIKGVLNYKDVIESIPLEQIDSIPNIHAVIEKFKYESPKALLAAKVVGNKALGTKTQEILINVLALQYVRMIAAFYISENSDSVVKVLENHIGNLGAAGRIGGKRTKMLQSMVQENMLKFKTNYPFTGKVMSSFFNGKARNKITSNLKFFKSSILGSLNGLEPTNVILHLSLVMTMLKGCGEQYAAINSEYHLLLGIERNLLSLELEMEAFKFYAENEYQILKNNITDQKILQVIEKITNTEINITDPSNDFLKQLNEVRLFVNLFSNSKLSYNDTYHGMEKLIAAMTKINYKLRCVKTSLSAISNARLQCSKGHNSFANIIRSTKGMMEIKLSAENCPNQIYAVPESNIKYGTIEAMKLLNKSSVCIRNKLDKN